MEPPQAAWVCPVPLPPVVVSPVTDVQVMLKLPPPVLEKPLRLPVTTGVAVPKAVSGPNAVVTVPMV